VTCDALDAVPFLLGLPADEAEQAKLIVTPHLAEVLEEGRMAFDVHVSAGLSTLDALRSVAASSHQPIAIVICPDSGSLFRCRSFVRARLLAPWVVSRGARADLIEIQSGGEVRRKSPGLTRDRLVRTIYAREACLMAEYAPRAVVLAALVVLLVMATLARLIPFVLWTEVRALMRVRRS